LAAFHEKVNAYDVMEVDNIVGKFENINLITLVLLKRDDYNIIALGRYHSTLISWQALKS
jgi:hypothetical protein